MNSKKIISPIISLLLAIQALFIISSTVVCAKGDTKSGYIPERRHCIANETIIKICNREIINQDFYGFGAETLPWLWTEENKQSGVDRDDIMLNLRRIKYLNLPITRIFVPWETWNPSVDYKTFTWDSDEMSSLYNMLDVYQEMGTDVILVTVDWLQDSPWRKVESSARAVLELLEYLIKKKGYTCIRYWTLTNEPELTYGWLRRLPFKNYIQIHRIVKEGIKKRDLSVKIIVSDEVESLSWFRNCVQSLSDIADVFSSHIYLYPHQKQIISRLLRERMSIIRRASQDKNNIPDFFICEFGFRGLEFGACINSLADDYEYGLYIACFCIELLNSGVDAASLWCLHQIRLIDEINPEGGNLMRIGLWAYKDKDWQIFPIFHLYKLFTKFIKRGSKVLSIKNTSSKKLKVACIEYKGEYSVFIVNMDNNAERFIIKGLPKGLKMKRYIYIKSSLNNFNKENRNKQHATTIVINDYLRDIISPKSVLIFTTFSDKIS